MKNYAGLDLYQIDPANITMQDVQRIKEECFASNSYNPTYITHCNRSAKVIQHISNYFKLNLVNARTPAQQLAFAFKYLPESCGNMQEHHSFTLVMYVKQILKDSGYQTMDLFARTKLVESNKKLLNYTANWDESVHELYDAITRSNIDLAYNLLKSIEALDKKLHKDVDNEYIANILSIQIINYLEIIAYMRNIIIGGLFPFVTPELTSLYESVNNALNDTLKKMLELPETKQKKSTLACLDGMFFSCFPRKIAPEEISCHASNKNSISKRFNYQT